MRSLKKLSFVVAALMASTAMVQAADIIPAPVHDPLPPEVVPAASAGGWYIRGDIGYASMKHKGVRYYQGNNLTGEFEVHDLDATWALQGGLGYQITDYFRADGTLTYYGASDFTGSSAQRAACNGFADTCDYADNTEMEAATVLLANAYVDLGTVSGFTAYAGAGIGAAYVKYGTLLNDQTCDGGAAACNNNDFVHVGEESWRFAYALHAGVSYDLSCRTKIDAGYTYTHINSGAMFGGDTTNGSSAGYDEGIDIHAGRLGLRYALSDAGCHTPVYEQPPVVYK